AGLRPAAAGPRVPHPARHASTRCSIASTNASTLPLIGFYTLSACHLLRPATRTKFSFMPHKRLNRGRSAAVAGRRLFSPHFRGRRARLRRPVVKHIAVAPHRLDVMATASSLSELFAQLANENVEGLEFGFVHSSIELVEKVFSGHSGTLAQTEQFENGVLLIGQMDRLVVDRNDPSIQVDDKLPNSNRRFRMPVGAAHNQLNARNQLATIKGFHEEVVSAGMEKLESLIELAGPRKDQDGRTPTRCTEPPQRPVAFHVRQHQVEENYVVLVEPSHLWTVLSEVGRITGHLLFCQDQSGAGGCERIKGGNKHLHEKLQFTSLEIGRAH